MGIRNWIDRMTGVKQLREQLNNASSNISILREALGGKVVGYWASDHYRESKQYKGHVYCAVSLILDQIAQATVVPKELNERQDSDVYERIHKPNPEQGIAEFNEARVLQMLLTGCAVIWNVENGAGGLAERYVIPTSLVAPTRAGFRITLNAFQGVTWSEYPVKLFSILSELIPYENCQVIRFPHPIQLGDGMSPVSAAAEWIDLADQIDNSRFNVMAKSARPGSKITEAEYSNLKPEDRDRFKAQLKAVASGTENAGDHLFVPRGLVMEPWALTSEEIDHVNGFEQIRNAIYDVMRVDPSDTSSHAEFYAKMLKLVELRIQPILNRLAAADKRTLEYYYGDAAIPEEFGYRAHRIDEPDQIQAQARTMREVGGFTFNEIRQVLKYPTLDKPGMDTPILDPINDRALMEAVAKTDETSTGISDPSKVKPDTAVSDGATLDTTNGPAPQADAVSEGATDLRATVGGLQAVMDLQTRFYDGSIPREAAIANIQLLFGFSADEANRLFPDIKPEDKTDKDAETSGGNVNRVKESANGVH